MPPRPCPPDALSRRCIVAVLRAPLLPRPAPSPRPAGRCDHLRVDGLFAATGGDARLGSCLYAHALPLPHRLGHCRALLWAPQCMPQCVPRCVPQCVPQGAASPDEPTAPMHTAGTLRPRRRQSVVRRSWSRAINGSSPAAQCSHRTPHCAWRRSARTSTRHVSTSTKTSSVRTAAFSMPRRLVGARSPLPSALLVEDHYGLNLRASRSLVSHHTLPHHASFCARWHATRPRSLRVRSRVAHVWRMDVYRQRHRCGRPD